MLLPVSKYSGCGNEFFLLDYRIEGDTNTVAAITPFLCDRNDGIGADGVVVVERSDKADYRMRIFNADGSEAEMCGNGLRCLIQFLRDKGEVRSRLTIETKERVLQTHVEGEQITIDMGTIQVMHWQNRIVIEGKEFDYAFLNTGVPHIVLTVDDFESFDLKRWGPLLRHHEQFGPKGTNVNIVKVIDDHAIQLRTFERGVEAETLACGTGATAAALVMSRWCGMCSPVEVVVKSGDRLKIKFEWKKDQPANVQLSGSATALFDGQFRINSIQ